MNPDEFDQVADAVQSFRFTFHAAIANADHLTRGASMLPTIAALLPDTFDGTAGRQALTLLVDILTTTSAALNALAPYLAGIDDPAVYGATVAMVQQLNGENPT